MSVSKSSFSLTNKEITMYCKIPLPALYLCGFLLPFGMSFTCIRQGVADLNPNWIFLVIL